MGSDPAPELTQSGWKFPYGTEGYGRGVRTELREGFVAAPLRTLRPLDVVDMYRSSVSQKTVHHLAKTAVDIDKDLKAIEKTLGQRGAR